MRRALAAAVPAALAALPPLVLAACSSAVVVEPAEDAEDAGCSPVLLLAPDVVADLARREVTAQGAAAWGDGEVVLRCGVPTPPAATTELCQAVGPPGGPTVDWIVEGPDEDGGDVVATTYGRTPALEVVVGPGTDPGAALVDLAAAAAEVPQGRACRG